MSSQKRKRRDGGETFRIVKPNADCHSGKNRDICWTHKLYRGPNGAEPRVTYCRTLAECEAAFERLSDSLILGFDLEWKPNDGPNIKDMVSVIQVASESDIVVIHIAAFPGGREMTRQQLLSPALKRMLENKSIIKAGLRIALDGNRMREHLGVYMQGALDVGKLRPAEPHLINPSLTTMTEVFLGFPMDKNPATSPWHREGALSQDQIDYAATDAYAGLKLYQYFIGNHNASSLGFIDFRAPGKRKPDPPSLLSNLKRLRLQLTADPMSKISDVGSNAKLEAIVKYRPTTLSALNRVPGFSSSTLLKYQKAIVDLVQGYVISDPSAENTNNIVSSPDSQATLEIAGAPNRLTGLTFVITGVIPNLSRDNARKLIERFGGKTTMSPSITTSYVVLGKDPGRKKVEQIGTWKLETVDEDGLVDLVNTRLAPSNTNKHEKPQPRKRARKAFRAGASPTASSSFVLSPQSLLPSESSPNSSQQSSCSSHFSSPSLPSSQPIASSQDQISISSKDSEASSTSEGSADSQSTTNIYNILYFLRKTLSQLLHLSPEEIATDDLLEMLAEQRPTSSLALKNLGGERFAEMVRDYDGSDILEICRDG